MSSVVKPRHVPLLGLAYELVQVSQLFLYFHCVYLQVIGRGGRNAGLVMSGMRNAAVVTPAWKDSDGVPLTGGGDGGRTMRGGGRTTQ